MSLNHLKLSPFLVKELYENSLTDIDSKPGKPAAVPKQAAKPAPAKKDEPESPENKIASLGNNRKNILVAVNESSHPFLADDELNFLIAVLGACQISMEDIALVNCCNNTATVYETLNGQFAPAIILFLGTEPQELGFPVQIPQYRVQNYNAQQYLCAPSLQKLSSDKEAKKQLWTALKQLFSIG